MKFFIEKLITIGIFYLSTTCCYCQEDKTLAVGDTLPDIEIVDIINKETEAIKLEYASAELFIIDFWATTCGTCLASFPKLDSLQQHFQDKILIIAVTQQSKEIVSPFFHKQQKWMGVTFPIIVGDTVLHEFFPHRAVPHVIWLSKDREVLAITDNKAVTAENILQKLQDADTNLFPTKTNK